MLKSLLLFGIIGIFFIIIGKIKEARAIKQEKKDELEQVLKKEIKIYNTDKLDKEFKVLGMVEGESVNDRDEAYYEMLKKAEELGADAIINFTEDISNEVSGYTDSTGKGLFGMGGVKSVSGSTDTTTYYFLKGTAIKFQPKKEKSYEEICLEQIKIQKEYLKEDIIDEVEFKRRKQKILEENKPKEIEAENNTTK